MAWGNITGEEQIIPSGQSNELVLESGKPRKVRLLLAPGEEPYSFFQHSIEHEYFENGQQQKSYRTVNCPKTKANPYAHCPLCDGQQARRRVRHVAKVWDYETSSVKYLCNGEQIWEPIATLVKMGMDPTTVDWVLSKTGEGRNGTKYAATNMGPSPFDASKVVDTLRPTTEEYKPHTIEEMQAIVGSMGGGMRWDMLLTPPPLEYPESIKEALAHVVPNTKYKGQTMEAIYKANPGMIEFFANSNRVSPEKAIAKVILKYIGGRNDDLTADVPQYVDGLLVGGSVPAQNTQNTQPQQQPVQNVQPTAPVQQPAQNTAPAGNGRTEKINEINKLMQTSKKFIDGGYPVILDTLKEAGNGKTSINEFTDAELDKMLELCQQ